MSFETATSLPVSRPATSIATIIRMMHHTAMPVLWPVTGALALGWHCCKNPLPSMPRTDQIAMPRFDPLSAVPSLH